jgi:replicative DNA helicase
VYFYARPKSLKTWLLLYSAVHVFKRGFRPLVISKEMPTEQIRRRIHAIFAAMDYHALRTGRLTPREEQRYFEDLEAFSENDPFILSGDDEDKGGVMSVSAKIREYDPDVVFIDGVYLMHDDRTNKRTSDWQGIAHITQDLKRMAKQLDIPVIGSTQANRSAEKSKGESKSEVAYGDSFTQDADYLIRIIFEKQQQEDHEAIITLPVIREAPGCTFTINTFIAKDLTQKRVAEDDEEAEMLLAGTDEGASNLV